MAISSIRGGGAAHQAAYAARKAEKAAREREDGSLPVRKDRDRVELGAPAEPRDTAVSPELAGDIVRKVTETAEEPEEKLEQEAEGGEPVPGVEQEETEDEAASGKVGINAAKLARRLAAAKTRSQVREVLALIQSDLKECENGEAQGMDVDANSVAAAERLLQQARQRLGSVEDREPTPQEEMASMLASLL